MSENDAPLRGTIDADPSLTVLREIYGPEFDTPFVRHVVRLVYQLGYCTGQANFAMDTMRARAEEIRRRK